jgi:hypothetical protein
MPKMDYGYMRVPIPPAHYVVVSVIPKPGAGAIVAISFAALVFQYFAWAILITLGFVGA